MNHHLRAVVLSGAAAFIAIAALILVPSAPDAQDPTPVDFPGMCGSDVTPVEAQRYLELEKQPRPQPSPESTPAPYCVPIAGHIVRKTNGTGGLTVARFNQAIVDANVAYANTGIVFYALGIDYIDSDFYYSGITTSADIDALRSLNIVADAINMYFTPTLPGLCGISSFTFSTYQGIVMNNSCTGVPDDAATVPHEIGHYFDLFHTHETAFGLEFVDGTNCTSAGDRLCDTPADPNLSTLVSPSCVYTGGVLDPHGDPYSPDTHQFMSYSRSTCMNIFSPLSEAKAVNTLLTSRSNLLVRGCSPVTPAVITGATPPTGFLDETLDIVLVGDHFAQFTFVDLGPGVTVNSADTLSTNDSLQVNITIDVGTTLGLRDIVVNNAFDPDTLFGAFEIFDTPRHYVSPGGSNHYPYALPSTAAPTLASVIAAVGDGDSVLVDSTTVNNVSFIVSRPLVLSGSWTDNFTARNPSTKKTILNLSDNIVIGAVSPVVIDGFDIRGGDGSSSSGPVSGKYGGGINAFNAGLTLIDCALSQNDANTSIDFGGGGGLYVNGGTFALTNCEFHDNVATRGGAVYLYKTTGSITGCTIENNVIAAGGSTTPEGAGVAVDSCLIAVTMSGNVIRSNTGASNGGGVWVKHSAGVSIDGGEVSNHTVTGDGAGIYLSGASATLDGISVAHNTAGFFGGGVSAASVSTLTADGCAFLWNAALIGGGVVSTAGTATVRHNLFVGNSATSTGGALYLASLVGGEVIGNTADRNSAPGGTGGFVLANSVISVRNNVLTNSAGNGFACAGTPPVEAYNLVWNSSVADYSGCAAGTGSISSDPLFADTASVDYHLTVHSPAIDAGDPTPSDDDPDGSRADMGRYGSHSFVMDQPSYPKNVATNVSAGQLTITWDRNPEDDVAYYAVYCDTIPGFVPSVGTFVSSAPDTFLTITAPTDTTHYRVSAVDTSGYASGYSEEATSTPTVTAAGDVALRYRLLQNVPNPFNPTTSIEFTMASPGRVDLVVYDVAGRRVRTLVGGTRAANTYKVTWDGTDDRGAHVASGIYFYRLTAGRFVETRKMVLLK